MTSPVESENTVNTETTTEAPATDTTDRDPVRMYMCGVYFYCLSCAPHMAASQPSGIRQSRMPIAAKYDCDRCGQHIPRNAHTR
ncbi:MULTISPECIES: hypothetical protein [unclassified Streptomyces]|uniref:hypothetical protein n=1 Tax=unclassified Streptomyces TaxID=2593676 RepID=UPI00224CB7C0|nr:MULTISPECIES: hypothetical protein [unclassified Streptomyces]MCX4871096.1 hypothetical protein [Streptomyces sp. NBC_00906]MCX4902718.1 hypothetical protein [Streptomyces sp. NBC_00892]